MGLRRVVVLALLVAAAGAEAASARPSPPLARDVTTDGVTLTATLTTILPARARGAVHFSWRPSGGAWRRTVPRRTRSRRVSVRLAGLRPGTSYRFRLVSGGRAGRSAVFATLPAPPPPPPAPPIAEPPSRTAEPPPDPPPAEPAPEPAPDPPGYRNPVGGDHAFPDPTVIRDDDGEYWAYATGDRFPIMRSADLVHWRAAGHALDGRPAWAHRDDVADDWHPWAPSVAKSDNGYVLFFVALSDAGGTLTNCIGVATAATPAGPFTDHGPLSDADGAPVGCGDDTGLGNIDPAPFVDADGSAYLYVSTDHACGEAECALAPELSVIPLTPDLLAAAAPRVPLFRGIAQAWEQAPWAPVVENPWVVERDGTYHLLYSGGAWTGDYGMGHATASSPLGPFTRTQRILAPTADARGAGGGMPIEGPNGGEWLAYHARAAEHPAPRTLRIDPLAWPDDGGPPEIAGPSAGAVALLP
jgi:Glycosyl hydrolases family 43